MDENYLIRPAQRQDAQQIVGLIRAMAQYEKLENQVVVTPELLQTFIFDQHKAEVLLLEKQGIAVGYALFFESFSTFMGRSGLYLEDLFVNQAERGRGMGKALFKAVAAEAVRRGCPRLEWACLDWNQPSIDFYRSLQAEAMEQWTTYRLTGAALLQAGTE